MAMLDLIRMNPFDDRFARSFFARPWPAFPTETPENLALDVYQKNGDLVVKAALPGIDKKDVKITIADDLLTISGEHKEEKEVKETDYYLKENFTGSFQRSVRLSPNAQADKASASFENGVLFVTIPQKVAADHKPIEVQVQSKD